MTTDKKKWSSVVESFGQLLIRLPDDSRELVFVLLESFLYCDFFGTFPLVSNALESIPAELVSNVSEVFLLPLAETGANGKAKSPSALLYPAAYDLIPYITTFAGKKPIPYERMELLEAQQPNRSQSLIIFLDDFVGTGKTALRTINRFKKNFAKPSDRFVVVAAVAQEQGIDKLTSQNIAIYTGVARQKGISESTSIANRAAALAIMDGLESRLGVSNGYRRGYGECEALVALMRTPNNTFPIFWWPTTASGDTWPAPFNR